MYLYFLLIVLTIVSFCLTYLVRNIAIKKKLNDIPNERSLHSMPTPRIGGLAINITWYIGLIILYLFNYVERELFYALLSGILLAIISFIDDIKPIKAYVRLVVHLIVSLNAFIMLKGLRPFEIAYLEINYPIFIYPLVIIGMIWFINLFNFMDGSDGFAATEAIIIGISLFLFSNNFISLLLVASILGFLFWNWPKAKIFMGDIGSTQLGFILIVFGIYFHNNYDFSILNWIMLAGPFWFDATFTLYKRWRNKEKISEAHKKHAYQRFIQAGYSHSKVNIFLISINIIIISLIYIYREWQFLKLPIIILTISGFYLIYKIADNKVPFSQNKNDNKT